MRKFLVLATIAFGIAVVVLELYMQSRKEGSTAPPELVVLKSAPATLDRFGTVPGFSLIDRSGATVTLSDLKGKVWLATFVFTTCPDSCPMLSSRLADWQQDILAAGDTRLVSFSVDPEHDTPEVLQGYARRFHATDRWFFLTGDKVQVIRIARKGFLLGFESTPKTSGTSGGITHSTKIALVDKNGVVRRFYNGIGPDERQKMLADLKTVLNEVAKEGQR